MKIQYQQISFPSWKEELIGKANVILAAQYRSGFKLTLRGLYYKLLSAKLFPEHYRDKEGTINNIRTYKNLGVMMNDARLAGLVDWNHIADITRGASGGGGDDEPEDLIANLYQGYSLDKWEDQPQYVEIWGEKDAVKGILQKVGWQYNCPYMSCRGSLGQTAAHDRARDLRAQIINGKEATVLYVGDLDPTGQDMSRDLESRMKMFLSRDGLEDSFTLKRVALNHDQVRNYNLEPDPVKLTDNRSNKFIEQFGPYCYELDAMDSTELFNLLSSEVEALIDDDVLKETLQEEKDKKLVLAGISKNWPSIEAHIQDLIDRGEYDPEETDDDE